MDIMTLSHNDLIDLVRQQQTLIAEQRATIERLERRVHDLEAGGGPPRGMPGHKRQQATTGAKPPRRKRVENHARRRSEPTARVVHALASCPDCGSRLAGGSVKRRREAIEVTPVPASITEHVYLERCCPDCGRRWTPPADLADEVVGQSRLGIGLLSLIATLREEARLPIRAIQEYLTSVHGLALSVGGIVGALGQVARVGQTTRNQLLASIRASPVIYADETGWRQDGANGYCWTLSTPDARYYAYGGRGNDVVDQLLGIDTAEEATGILVSDFYAAYNHYPGVQQKCWVHLVRDINDLVRQYPADADLADWAAAVRAVYERAATFQSDDAQERQCMRRQVMAALAALCQPFQEDEAAPQRVLCRRIEKHLHSLFVFVLEPAVAADNNAAERSLRHTVISRKISGGTRSEQGAQTKVTLATLFGTWRARGENPYTACRELLLSPQR
jgi:hypothetical protein